MTKDELPPIDTSKYKITETGQVLKMTKEELEREYCGCRPTEPYSEDDSPNDWANIVQYAEENLGKAFKAIAELEKEKCELLGIIQGKDKVIQELEKENANLKALRKYELNVAKLEIEKLEQRNAKLIALINAERERQEKCDDVHLRKIAELEKENAGLKAFRRDCIKLTEDNVVMAKQRGEIAAQLTKAKEIIKDYMTIVKGAHTTVCGVSEENRTIYVLQLNEEAEEFLNSEVEQ